MQLNQQWLWDLTISWRNDTGGPRQHLGPLVEENSVRSLRVCYQAFLFSLVISCGDAALSTNGMLGNGWLSLKLELSRLIVPSTYKK